MVCHDTLTNYYLTNHALKKNWNYSVTELEEMIPYERDFIINIIMRDIEQDDKQNNKPLVGASNRWDAKHGVIPEGQ
jgi:hypothetical protein